MWKTYKENSTDLNFAIGSIYCQAINLTEFEMWVEKIIREVDLDEIPNYFFDLIDFQSLYDLIDIIGFVPENNLSKNQDNALTGIAFLRGIDVYDPPVSKEKALKALEKHPEIYQRFQHFFPFVELPPL
ncbi:TPA: hypothetical protein ACLBIP_000349 [Neisseria meningitidis]